jgi:hypothetical protein
LALYLGLPGTTLLLRQVLIWYAKVNVDWEIGDLMAIKEAVNIVFYIATTAFRLFNSRAKLLA